MQSWERERSREVAKPQKKEAQRIQWRFAEFQRPMAGWCRFFLRHANGGQRTAHRSAACYMGTVTLRTAHGVCLLPEDLGLHRPGRWHNPFNSPDR